LELLPTIQHYPAPSLSTQLLRLEPQLSQDSERPTLYAIISQADQKPYMRERCTMGIIQMFTKQHPKTMLGTTLRMMQGMITDEQRLVAKNKSALGLDKRESASKVIQLTATKTNDNLYTTQTPEYSKGKYNVKIRKQKSLLRSHQQSM
jgi:hypothetical protein